MNNFLEWISSNVITHWSNLVVVAGVIGGALVMWRNILTIRKLRAELKDIQKKKRTEATKIKIATDVEIAKYGIQMEIREYRAHRAGTRSILNWLFSEGKWIMPMVAIVLIVYYSTLLFKIIAVISVGSYLFVGRLKQKATSRNVDEFIELQRYQHIRASLEEKGITKQMQPTQKARG